MFWQEQQKQISLIMSRKAWIFLPGKTPILKSQFSDEFGSGAPLQEPEQKIFVLGLPIRKIIVNPVLSPI
jgi:hypothetical protein